MSSKMIRRATLALALVSGIALLGFKVEKADAQSATPKASPQSAKRAAFLKRDAQARANVEALLRRAGVMRVGASLHRTRPLAPRAATHTTRVQAATTATTSLVFVPKNLSAYSDFVKNIYPYLVGVYGEPSPFQRGKTVSIEHYRDSNGAEADEGYGTSLDGSNGGYINFNPSGNRDDDQIRLAQLMLSAFHGRQAFAYDLGSATRDPKNVDAWEYGMSSAAALYAYYFYKGSPSNFNPVALAGYYFLPVYDLFNTPDLGGPLFLANSPDDPKAPFQLAYIRELVSQAVWIKVAVENPNFFKQFNAFYYQQVAMNPSLASNVPALESLAASVVPQVEGLRFSNWVRRQYVLDARGTLGEKLWIGLAPYTTDSVGSSNVGGIAYHYRGFVQNGEYKEEFLGGLGTVGAFDETGRDISSLSPELALSNQISFERSGAYGQYGFSLGFSNTGTPNAGRIVLQLQVGTLRGKAIFPYHVAGVTSTYSGIYGAVAPANSGTVSASVNNGTPVSTLLQRGAFALNPKYSAGPQTKFVLRFTSNAGEQVAIRNAAWCYNSKTATMPSFAVLLEGASVVSTARLQIALQGDNRLRMVSVPLAPLASDESDVFKIAPNNLLLGRYRPEAALGAGAGLNSWRYEFYPRMSQPVGPGRGYWLAVFNPLSVDIPGEEPTRTVPFEIPLRGGWNQIGAPYNLPFSVDALRVKTPTGAELTYAQAIAARVLTPGVWRWKAGGGYERVDWFNPWQRVIVPFEGLFVCAAPSRGESARGYSLIFDASRQGARPVYLQGQNWQFPLTLQAGSYLDDGQAFGTSPLDANGFPVRLPAPKPPLPGGFPNLRFASSGNALLDATGAGDEGGWGETMLPPLQAGKGAVWRFRVDGVGRGVRARIAWFDPRYFPPGFDFYFWDDTRGALNMRQVTDYIWSADGRSRNFHIEAVPISSARAANASAIEAWSAQILNGSSAAQLSLQVVGGAVAASTARVEIWRDGALVRTLADKQTLRATQTRWTWDGRDDNGQRLPTGNYSARVHVSLPDGRVETRETDVSLR